MLYTIRYCFPVRGGDTRYHDFHHSKNVGAYGRNELWDVAFGSADAWIKHVEEYPTLQDHQRALRKQEQAK